MSKLTTLEQLKLLAQRVKTEDDALGARITEIAEDVEGLVSTGGEANVLEGVKVNGQALAITDKMVDLLIASGDENGTLSVNGAAVAITGLKALAYKANISESDLDSALKASIAAKATNADLQALTVRVTTAEGDITEIKGDIQSLQNAGYQTSAQVQSAIQTAIAATGHAHFEKVSTVPTAATAKENVLYLVMNSETGHYDIYALVSGKVELLDDTTVDLSAYSTTAQMNAAIESAVDALNIGDYAKAADLVAAIGRITALENKFSNYYTKDEVDAELDKKMNVSDMGTYATDAEAAAEADAAEAAAKAHAEQKATAAENNAKAYTDEQLAANTASDSEVSDMLDGVFGA